MSAEIWISAAIAFAVSVAGCRAVIAWGPLDQPNEARKAHRTATPTSGGLGIGLAFMFAIAILHLMSPAWRAELSAGDGARDALAIGLALGFLVLGYIDDTRVLGPRLKFAIFAALSFAAAQCVGVVTELPIGADVFSVGAVLGLCGTALFVFTLVNAVNFMDGSNGLSMGSVALGLAALAVIQSAHGALGPAILAMLGAAALAGFLVWNFPAGRLFAGDSGSLFAGALAAIVSLMLIDTISLSPFVAAIVFLPLLADVLLTLAWRAKHRRSLLQAHADHLYQIAIRGGWSHRRAAIAYWLAALVCGAIAIVVARMPNTGADLVALATLALVSIVITVVVRKAVRASAARGAA